MGLLLSVVRQVWRWRDSSYDAACLRATAAAIRDRDRERMRLLLDENQAAARRVQARLHRVRGDVQELGDLRLRMVAHIVQEHDLLA